MDHRYIIEESAMYPEKYSPQQTGFACRFARVGISPFSYCLFCYQSLLYKLLVKFRVKIIVVLGIHRIL